MLGASVAVGAVALVAGAAPLVNQRRGAKTSVTADLPPAALTQVQLDRLRASIGAPALAAAVQAETGPMLGWVSGVRMRGAPGQVTVNDRWHVGSITKSMTATLVARCVEAGLVSWDDTIGEVLGEHLPEIENEYRDATFVHLLSHRAGLQTDVMDLGVIGLPFREEDARDSRLVIARHALRQTPVGPREETFTYSQSGYVIAAAMLETKSGLPWEELMRQHVFAPLGMQSAGFGPPGLGDEGAQPVGHASWITQSITPRPPGEGFADIPAAWAPAGAVHVAMTDLLKFLNAHRDRAPLLAPESWEMLHMPPFGGDYALGWYLRNGGLWHNGTNSMWYAEVLVDTAQRKSVVAVCNDGRLETVTPIVHAVLMSAVLHDSVHADQGAPLLERS